MGMTEDDKRSCCLLEIQETEAKYYRTLEDIEKVSLSFARSPGAQGLRACSRFLSVAVIRLLPKELRGEESVFIVTSRLQTPFTEVHAGTQAETAEKSRLLTRTGSCLAAFLHSPGPPGQRLVLLTVGRVLLH